MKEDFGNNTVTYRQLAETLGSTEQLSEYLEKDDFKVMPLYARLNDAKVLLTMATYCTENSNVVLGDSAITQHKYCAECIIAAAKGNIIDAVKKFILAVDSGGVNNIFSTDREDEALNRRVNVNEAITLYDALVAIQSAIEYKLPYIE